MLKSLLRVERFIRRYRGRIAGGVLLFFLARLSEASVPLFLKVGIDRVAEGEADLWLPILGILGGVFARFVFVSWARISVRRAGLLVAFDLRQAFYRHLQQMGPGFFQKFSVGDLMTRAVADISLIQRLISVGTVLVVILLFATIVGLSCMVYLSPSLTLLILPPMPLVALFAWYCSRRLGTASRVVQERLGGLGALVQENLSGIRTVQAMVQEKNEIRRFQEANQGYARAFHEHARLNSIIQAGMPSLAVISILIIVGFGGSLVLDGDLSIGAFTAFFFYVNMVVQPFQVAGFIISLFQRAGVAAERLFKVFDTEPEIKDHPSASAPHTISGQLEIRALAFAFDDRSKVLDGVSLAVSPGETIAVMGRVGSGKSTLLRLIVRMLDTPSESVYADGTDVCDFPLRQLRSHIAYVPQEAFLFAEPIWANITYDEPTRPRESVWQAARWSALDSTIREMPEEMDTIVGERGVTLSGGQKQRAALARGLIRHAPVLLLDDCFASVDTDTEESILMDLRRIREDKTTILVSHRVSTALHADRIIVLSDGKISESGTHQELLSRGGFYASLERIQREGAGESDYSPGTTE